MIGGSNDEFFARNILRSKYSVFVRPLILKLAIVVLGVHYEPLNSN